MAGFYAAYHGSEGLKKIADRILRYRETLKTALKWCGKEVDDTEGFDTVRIKTDIDYYNFLSDKFNVGYEDGWMMITLDELTTIQELDEIVQTQIVFNAISKYNKACI